MLLDALHEHGPRRSCGGSRRAAVARSRAWSRAARSAAPTTSTGRCGSSTPTASPQRLMDAGAASGARSSEGELAERLAREEFEARLQELRELIEAEIRRRLVADRGVEAMARTLRKPLPEDVDFMHASREEMQQLQRAIYPLTRALAARLAQRRRRRHRGHLDFRQTVRALAVVRRRAGRAEVQAPAPVEARDHGRRRHLRLGRELRPLHAAVRLRDGEPVLEGAVVGVHRRHRRGHPLLRGVRRHHRGGPPREHRGRRRVGRRPLRLRPRVRDVARAPLPRDHAEDVDHPARRRAQQLPRVAGVGRSTSCASARRHVYWLNPEPRGYWDTGDSIVSEYGAYCDGVYECRNLRQLQRSSPPIVEG